MPPKKIFGWHPNFSCFQPKSILLKSKANAIIFQTKSSRHAPPRVRSPATTRTIRRNVPVKDASKDASVVSAISVRVVAIRVPRASRVPNARPATAAAVVVVATSAGLVGKATSQRRVSLATSPKSVYVLTVISTLRSSNRSVMVKLQYAIKIHNAPVIRNAALPHLPSPPQAVVDSDVCVPTPTPYGANAVRSVQKSVPKDPAPQRRPNAAPSACPGVSAWKATSG